MNDTGTWNRSGVWCIFPRIFATRMVPVMQYISMHVQNNFCRHHSFWIPSLILHHLIYISARVLIFAKCLLVLRLTKFILLFYVSVNNTKDNCIWKGDIWTEEIIFLFWRNHEFPLTVSAWLHVINEPSHIVGVRFHYSWTKINV